MICPYHVTEKSYEKRKGLENRSPVVSETDGGNGSTFRYGAAEKIFCRDRTTLVNAD